MISKLKPLDFVFRDEYVLHFDESKKQFRRCFVLQCFNIGYEIYLIDEGKTIQALGNSLYEMRARFFNFHSFAFQLIMTTANRNVDVSPYRRTLVETVYFQLKKIVTSLEKCIVRGRSVEVKLKEKREEPGKQ